MPKFRYTEWQNVASEVQTLRLTVLDQLNSFKEAQQAFQSAGKLSGTGWDSTKSYFDAYSEVSTTVGNALNTLDDVIISYLSAFTSEVGPAENDLDTAKMEGLKAELRRLQAENDVIMEALAKAFEDVPFVNQFFNKQSMLGTAKKIEILEKYSAFEAAHGSDFSDVQTVIASITEGLSFLGSAGNFSGGKDGYKTIAFKNQKWYKALKDFNKAQPKDRIDVVIKELSNGVEYQIYRNGKLDVQKTKELHELFRVHNVELFKEYGPEIFKILTNIDDIEILLAKDSTTMQRSSSGVFLLLAVLPIDRVADILKSAKLLKNGDYTLDAIKLTAKEWETLKEFEKSADVVKTVDRGKDVGKVSGVGNPNYSYSPSVIEKAKLDPLYHDFPKNLDHDILSNPVITRADGRIEHLAKGTVNGESGVYQVTVKGDSIIHRTFIPESDWTRFSKVNELPEFIKIPSLK